MTRVVCPFCLAKPGQACREQNGRFRRAHVIRQEAVRREQ